jgi:hypothetical protein
MKKKNHTFTEIIEDHIALLFKSSFLFSVYLTKEKNIVQFSLITSMLIIS